jgi:hypothetical protein
MLLRSQWRSRRASLAGRPWKNTDAELLLTLERSQSHQWSMIMFIAGMALLLLVLDFLSP